MVVHAQRRLPLTRSAKAKPQSTNAVSISMSPISRRIHKAQQRLAQDAAFGELLLLRQSNGGKKKHGDIQMIVDKYKSRGHHVERSHIEYRMELRLKGTIMRGVNEAPTVINVPITDETVVSDLSERSESPVNNKNETCNNTLICESDVQRKGGRKKGTTINDKITRKNSVAKALTEAASLCSQAKALAKLDNKKLYPGTFKNLIKDTENKYGLEPTTIKFQTIKSRVLSKNLTGLCHQKISPLADVETIIVDCCSRLSKMGEALTKYEVMDLADNILTNTVHADRLVEFCEKRNINKNINNGKIVGVRWYKTS
jgi:hypothetical protein